MLIYGFNGFLGALDIRLLLHRAAHPASGGSGFAQAAGAGQLAAHKRIEDGGAKGNGRLHFGLTRLGGFTVNGLLRLADPLFQRGNLGRIFFAQ